MEHHESFDKGNLNDSNESLVLLTKNFNGFLKRTNKKKTSQNLGRSNVFQKSKKPVNTIENKKQGKGIQCKECEGFGHI